jgi:large subunit ribosomal protein L10
MLVTDLQQRIGDTTEILVVDSSRLDAISDNRFRLALREKDISVLTVKNSMALRALHSREITELDPILEGPSSLVYGGEDIVSLSKEIAGWVDELGSDLIAIKGGVLEGTTLSKGDVEELSRSPSREELIGQIAGLLLAPGANLAAALLGPGGKLAGQVEAIADGEGAADETTVDESAEEAGTEEAEEAGTEEAEEAGTEEAEEAGTEEAEESGAEEADSGDDAEAATETESEESDA